MCCYTDYGLNQNQIFQSVFSCIDGRAREDGEVGRVCGLERSQLCPGNIHASNHWIRDTVKEIIDDSKK